MRDGSAETVSRDQNSQARTGTGKYSFSLVQLTTSRFGNLARLIHTYYHIHIVAIDYRLHAYLGTTIVYRLHLFVLEKLFVLGEIKFVIRYSPLFYCENIGCSLSPRLDDSLPKRVSRHNCIV